MTPFISGNQIQLLRNGIEYFPALEAAIEHASHEIYLQTYIYEPDNIGLRIGEALKRAAQRGVTVNVLLDGFGCKNLPSGFVNDLEKAGVKIMFYRPKISPWTLKKSRLRRMHRKVAIIDGKVGFVGGINIIDDYNVPDNTPPRIDYAVRVEGKLLPAILISAHKLWRRISFTHLQANNLLQSYHLKTAQSEPLTPVNLQEKAVPPHKKHNVNAAFVLRDNVLNRRSIENAYLTAIAQAQTEIIIANAYFVPGRRFRKALLAAAKRGVNVKLLLQGRLEYFLMLATHAFYADFLKHSIEIYEYRKGYMHSKVAVIDSQWATVGSSNIDPFSLLLAREANVIVKDKHFATELRTDIMHSIEESAYHVLPEEWSSRHLFKRFLSWLAYGLVRVFVGLIGYSKEQ
ncbi:cardiolipin synthase ClsB [Methylotenera versatilis]|uniref:cardiolipin synthase ClsB n=1 Tax=Methylotenera versatilis TaxID=1055487 RepID=UPI0006488602|nr:cardiolipin synthase ClsB [Methylotenera versatilis]